jgi:hypothetical protein
VIDPDSEVITAAEVGAANTGDAAMASALPADLPAPVIDTETPRPQSTALADQAAATTGRCRRRWHALSPGGAPSVCLTHHLDVLGALCRWTAGGAHQRLAIGRYHPCGVGQPIRKIFTISGVSAIVWGATAW